MGGYKDDRDRAFQLGQVLLQIQAGQSGHPHIAPAGKSKENAFNLSCTMVRFVTATENSGTVHGREDESRVFGAFDFCGDDIIKKTACRGQVWRAAPRRGPLMIWLPANVQILGGMNHEDYSCV